MDEFGVGGGLFGVFFEEVVKIELVFLVGVFDAEDKLTGNKD